MKSGSPKHRAEESPRRAATSKKVFLQANGSMLTRIIVNMAFISNGCAKSTDPESRLQRGNSIRGLARLPAKRKGNTVTCGRLVGPRRVGAPASIKDGASNPRGVSTASKEEAALAQRAPGVRTSSVRLENEKAPFAPRTFESAGKPYCPRGPRRQGRVPSQPSNRLLGPRTSAE